MLDATHTLRTLVRLRRRFAEFQRETSIDDVSRGAVLADALEVLDDAIVEEIREIGRAYARVNLLDDDRSVQERLSKAMRQPP